MLVGVSPLARTNKHLCNPTISMHVKYNVNIPLYYQTCSPDPPTPQPKLGLGILLTQSPSYAYVKHNVNIPL